MVVVYSGIVVGFRSGICGVFLKGVCRGKCRVEIGRIVGGLGSKVLCVGISEEFCKGGCMTDSS